jgi:hypothetical protein
MSSGPGEMEVYRSKDGAEIAVVAATWHLNPKVTFDSLRLEFERNPGKAWRNYGSRLDGAAEASLKDPDLLQRTVNRVRLHPWEEDRQMFATWFRGRPGVRHFIHIDLAKNRDRAGVAMVHRDGKTGVVTVDFMDSIAARAGREIDIAEVRRRYVYEMTARGFHIERVTYDQWNSLESLQELKSRGYTADELSADKTMEPYDTLFDLINTGKLDFYLHPRFMREVEQLRLVGGKKYDHPKGGSKDISDAVACATHSALTFALDNPAAAPARIRVHRRTSLAPSATSLYD